MKKYSALFVVVLLLVFCVYGFPVMGARSMAMGGTGVAAADDSTAVYWNPAAVSLTRSGTFDLKIDFGVDIMQNISVHISDFEDIDRQYDEFMSDVEGGVSEWEAPLYAERFKELFNEYRETLTDFDDNGVGANLSMGAGMFFSFQEVGGMNVSLGITALSDSQFYSAEVDTTILRTIPMEYLSREGIRNALLDDGFSGTEAELQNEIDSILTNVLNELDSGTSVFGPGEYDELYAFLVTNRGEVTDSDIYGLENNGSRVVVNGILMNEFVVSLSKGLKAGPVEIGVGGNIKIIKGYNYSDYITVDDFRDGGEDNIFTEKFSDPFEGQTLGLDLAAYARLGGSLRAGLTIRNIIAGEIKWEEKNGFAPEGYKPATEVRIGVAYDPVEFLTVTADADITKVDGDYTDVRNIGLGAEARLAFLRLRGGAMFTPGLEDKLQYSDLILTGGLGVDLSIVKVDLAAMVAAGDTGFDFDEDNLPERVGMALSLGIKL